MTSRPTHAFALLLLLVKVEGRIIVCGAHGDIPNTKLDAEDPEDFDEGELRPSPIEGNSARSEPSPDESVPSKGCIQDAGPGDVQDVRKASLAGAMWKSHPRKVESDDEGNEKMHKKGLPVVE